MAESPKELSEPHEPLKREKIIQFVEGTLIPSIDYLSGKRRANWGHAYPLSEGEQVLISTGAYFPKDEKTPIDDSKTWIDIVWDRILPPDESVAIFGVAKQTLSEQEASEMSDYPGDYNAWEQTSFSFSLDDEEPAQTKYGIDLRPRESSRVVWNETELPEKSEVDRISFPTPSGLTKKQWRTEVAKINAAAERAFYQKDVEDIIRLLSRLGVPLPMLEKY